MIDIGLAAALNGRDSPPENDIANEVEEGKIRTVTLTSSKAAECFSKRFSRPTSSSDTLAAASLLRAAQSNSHREKERGEQGSALTEISAYCRQLKILEGPLFTQCLY